MQASVFLHLIPAPEVGLAYQPSTSEEWYLLSVLLESEGGCRPNVQPLELLLVILGHGQTSLGLVALPWCPVASELEEVGCL